MKICFITGSRSEYGLLSHLIKAAKNDPYFEVKIIATCMHLSKEFGYTIEEIEKDGFYVDEKLETLLSSDTPVGMVKSFSLTAMSVCEALNRVNPDIVVLLGDRFETFAAAVAANFLNIPIAHLHGGEITEGAIDDAIRHSITKLSHLHFTSTEEYRRRIIQMGEQPQNVFNVGAIVLDAFTDFEFIPKEKLSDELNIVFKKNNYLITVHPSTITKENIIDPLLQYLDELTDTSFFFTLSNADSGGREINEKIKYFTKRNKNAYLFSSLGHKRYLSLMKYVDVVVGNSSSGIVEAPALRIPTINIGKRQEGRIKAESIIDCSPEYQSIKEAFIKLKSDSFVEKLKTFVNPYGEGNVSEKIIKEIKTKEKDLKSLVYKRFYDLDFKFSLNKEK